MSRNSLLLSIFLLLVTTDLSAQSGTTFNWNVTGKRLEMGRYELHFVTTVPQGWQLYAPGQQMGGINSFEISFPDSTILIEGSLTAKGVSRQIKSSLFDNQEFSVFEKDAEFIAIIKINGTIPAKLLGSLKYTFGKTDEFYPLENNSFEVPLEGGVESSNRIKIETVEINNPVNRCGIGHETKQSSLFKIFLLGFLGGLVALITPCVFPMVPLTVSFFTKRASDKSKGMGSAALYGFFIFLIYTAFSIPFHIVGKVSPTIYNDISTNIYLNILFFLIFIVFAISFFGYFEITLPSSLANTAGAKRGGNVMGILFMALTLAIVSFSCTGPILGTLLVGTASEGAWPLTAGLAGFGLSLGLPFALFAMFPGWLQSLPKSGGWLNTVKVVLGFIELALALKFLSNADLVIHWGILKREIFFAIWLLIGLGLFAYLSGWLKFPHDDRQPLIGLPRRAFSFIVLGFVIYLSPGVTNTTYANLGFVSGFPPPHCYSIYDHPVNCDQHLTDYEEALKLAKEKNKPLLVDFTGWACVNCRKMEENVWPKPGVKKLMEEYILVSLYVDDKKALPANQQFVYTSKDSTVRKIITVGDKWSTFQTENFNASSQPWYIALSPDEKLLSPPKEYTPNAQEFINWLQCGIDAMGKLK